MPKRVVTISEYPVHPAAELFPMMSETEFQAMKEDIRLHGQNDDVLIWNGTLLDGRNRLRACTELGIEPGWAELPKTIDPVSWVLSHNLHRRHLTPGQRAMVAEKLATLQSGDNQHTKEGGSIEPPSRAEAAAQLKVSLASVKRARRVRAKASKKVIAAVEAGTMSLNAAEATTKPKASQAVKAAAKAAKEQAKAEAAAEKAREKLEAAGARQKLKDDAAEAKAEAQAAKEAAKAASLTTAGQITNIKSLINQHVGKLVRHLADLHRLKPNRAAFDGSKKACEGIKTW